MQAFQEWYTSKVVQVQRKVRPSGFLAPIARSARLRAGGKPADDSEDRFLYLLCALLRDECTSSVSRIGTASCFVSTDKPN